MLSGIEPKTSPPTQHSRAASASMLIGYVPRSGRQIDSDASKVESSSTTGAYRALDAPRGVLTIVRPGAEHCSVPGADNTTGSRRVISAMEIAATATTAANVTARGRPLRRAQEAPPLAGDAGGGSVRFA